MRKTKWVKLVERESDFWKNYMMISSAGDTRKAFGFTVPERLTTRRGMTFTHWLNPRAVWKYSLQIEKKLKANSKFLVKIDKVFAKSRQILLAVNKQLERTKLRRLSDKKLLMFYRRFCDAYKGLYPAFHLAVYIDSIEAKAKRWLLQALKKRGQEKKFDDYFLKLSAPQKPSLLQQEELSLARIALKIKRGHLNQRQIQKLLTTHIKKYAGLPVVNDESRPWAGIYFEQRLKRLLRKSTSELTGDFNQLRSYATQVIKEQEVLFGELRAAAIIEKFFYLIGLSIWIRLASRNTFALAHHSSKELFTEIGHRCGLAAAEIKWLTPAEVDTLILHKKSPNDALLAARKKVAVLLFGKGFYRIFVGQKAEEFINKELGSEVLPTAVDTLKGAIAFAGIAKGRAKIILSQKDIIKMQEGDILVARMTTPEIVPAVRQAAAIVTDEGGITCHAAIVSRELKIPCVVGTRFATKVLTDGDVIEVHAREGIGTIKKRL